MEAGGSGVVAGRTPQIKNLRVEVKNKSGHLVETLPSPLSPLPYTPTNHSDFPGPWIRRLIKRSNQIDRKLYVSWSIPNNTILTRIILCDGAQYI